MEFRVREYGRMELARLYSPDITGDAAWRKLKKWIEICPGLIDSLKSLGYDSAQRTFTPRQVQTIINALGEP